MALEDAQLSYETQRAAKLQLILDQPMSDMMTGLVNRDFEGDFFKVGDTVSIIKPDVKSAKIAQGSLLDASATGTAGYFAGTVTSGELAATADDRLDASDLKFSKSFMQIDKYMKYAFLVSDITKTEGGYNYESGGIDMVGHNIRKAHNLEIAELCLNDTTLKANATTDGMGAAAPISVANVDALYEEVILPMWARLYDAGAITKDGQVTFGSNPQQGKQTYGKIYVPTKLYTQLLKSKYLTDRSTVDADTKVETGKVKTLLGLEVEVEPALITRTAAVANDYNNVTVADAAAGTFAIVMGTRNAVTHAGKVLPPESFRSHSKFGTEYHGLEIYGQELISPESCAIAFCKLTA